MWAPDDQRGNVNRGAPQAEEQQSLPALQTQDSQEPSDGCALALQVPEYPEGARGLLLLKASTEA